MKSKFTISIIVVIIAYSHCWSRIIHIPDIYPTIQQGVDAISDGDTIIVHPGTYYENILIDNKEITLGSLYLTTLDSNYIHSTIIDGNLNGSVITLLNNHYTDIAEIVGFTIQNGLAEYGGGLNLYYTAGSIAHNIIKNNTAVHGGGIYAYYYCQPFISHNIINNNRATGANNGSNGGGIFCDFASPIIQYNNISYNEAAGGGGIAALNSADPIIRNNTILKNIATGWGTVGGGGIYSQENSDPKIYNNLIAYNITQRWGSGGGIATGARSYFVPIINNVIIYNSAGEDGGGIYRHILSPSDSIYYNIICDNNANEHGGGIYIYDGEGTTFGNTICNNRAGISGGGFHAPDHDIEVLNTICWYNSVPQISGEPDIAWSDIEGGFHGTGNIDLIPMLVAPQYDNYNICLSSPCIDAGYPLLYDPDSSRSDIGKYFPEHSDCTPMGNNVHVSVFGDDFTGNGTPLQPYRTIQHAINRAYYHDTVVVANGIYEEGINFNKMRVSLVSDYVYSNDTLDIINTVINGDSLSPVVVFDHHEDRLASISGFTIMGGLDYGIFCDSASPGIINNYIEYNYGSGIYSVSSNSVIQFNKVKNNQSKLNGGGIYLDRCNAEVSNNEIYYNSARFSGGGLYAKNESEPKIQFNTIILNRADSSGGGAYLIGLAADFSENSISKNSAYYGGGIGCITYYDDVHVSGNVISQNNAYEGGGVWLAYNCDLSQNEIFQNESGSLGGGVYCKYLYSDIVDNTIYNNKSRKGAGIAIVDGVPEIRFNEIRSNVAELEGGGIYSFQGKQNIFFNRIIGNIGEIGAGIMTENNWISRSYNNLILFNTASSSGGGIACKASNHHIINNTIANNSSNFSGGGLFIEDNSSVYTSNVVLWSNNSQYGAEISIDSLSALDINFSDIEGGYPGYGNINIDPLFRNPSDDDFHLMSTDCGDLWDSPCIDSGNPFFSDSLLDCMWSLGTAETDMGAYGGGYRTLLEVENMENVLPSQVDLLQNYPNPFNATTTIKFVLPDAGQVRIDIYDLLGRRVKTLMDEEMQAGNYQVVWDASNYSSGVYFYRIETGEFAETRKMILIK